jgi:hypothetical protein
MQLADLAETGTNHADSAPIRTDLHGDRYQEECNENNALTSSGTDGTDLSDYAHHTKHTNPQAHAWRENGK